MKTIKSRKHPQVHVMGAALAAVLLPLTGHAADLDGAAPDMAPSSKVEVVGKAENAFKAEQASSPKYTEKLVDTAQTVQVIKKELFEQQGAVTLTEALRNTPGVGAFFLGENGNTNTGDAIFMRGFDTSGSIFVDGARDIGSISRDTFNLEQIDVLKGPAGTDTGRGSPTGSINLVSKKANLTGGRSGSILGGTDSQKRATADLNTVLNAERGIALRLNAMAQDSGVAGRDVVNNKRWAVAPSLGFGLNGPTRVYLDYLHVDQDNVPDGGVPTIGLPGYISPDATRPFLTGAAPVDPKNFYGSVTDYDKIKADMATVRVEHEFAPNMRLSNVSRYGRTSQDYLLTAWMASTANFRTPVVADPSTWTVARSIRTLKDAENKILTNQTVLTADFSTGSVAHTLVSGLEFVNENQITYGRTGGGTLPAANLYRPNPRDPVSGQAITRTGAFNEGDIDTQSLFVFDTMKFGDRWIFNGGVRVDRYRGAYDAVALSGNALVATRINVAKTLVNGKASLLYKPTEYSSVYGMVATSKQPPGASFSASNNANNAQNPIFDPQETTNYELGVKLDLLRQKLALNAALFRTDVKNEVEQDPVDQLWYQTGKKRVQGIELGMTGALASNWLVSAGYLYMDTSVEAGRMITASGENSLTYTPKSSFTLWTAYDITPGFKIGGGARFSDELKRGTDGAVGTPKYAESYWVFDLMASYRVSPKLDLRLNVYNVADEEYVASINKSGYRYTPGAPRSASLTANFSF